MELRVSGVMMPQLVAVALVSVSAWYAYKWFRSETRRVETDMQRAERRLRRSNGQAAKAVDLRLDPATGVYFPASD
ncbi:MAG: hypothetical protein NW215_08785 [Hyphomicrobiales bacterium]|nr:hypothetical protein [Hyphomicrobiales bacterium]